MKDIKITKTGTVLYMDNIRRIEQAWSLDSHRSLLDQLHKQGLTGRRVG